MKKGFKNKLIYDLQFVKHNDRYVKGFIVVENINGKIFVSHTVSKQKTQVDYKDLKKYVKYFNRI